MRRKRNLKAKFKSIGREKDWYVSNVFLSMHRNFDNRGLVDLANEMNQWKQIPLIRLIISHSRTTKEAEVGAREVRAPPNI